MIITLNEPFADLRGSIGDDFYIRRSPTGKFIIQRKPRKASEKQRKMRVEFIKKYKNIQWRSYGHPTECYQ